MKFELLSWRRNSLKNKKILITGGAGFIGSHLCQSLLKKKHHVICLDNLISGQIELIKELQKNSQFTFIQGDITEAIPDLAVDEIYNLACPASPKDYQASPIQTIKTNVIGMANILDFAERKSAKVLQASTSEIYGDPEIHPQREDYWGRVNPIGIRSCYDEGKRSAETLCSDYYRSFDLDVKIARIFNTYGPHMRRDDGRVVSNFINQALRGEAITLYGQGLQTRSFCYVEDMISGLEKMMEIDCGVSPVNLGNPQELSMRDLALLILKLTKSKSEIIYQQLPSDDPRRRCPDISRAQSVLDWKPEVELVEGIERTIHYFKNL